MLNNEVINLAERILFISGETGVGVGVGGGGGAYAGAGEGARAVKPLALFELLATPPTDADAGGGGTGDFFISRSSRSCSASLHARPCLFGSTQGGKQVRMSERASACVRA